MNDIPADVAPEPADADRTIRQADAELDQRVNGGTAQWHEASLSWIARNLCELSGLNDQAARAALSL